MYHILSVVEFVCDLSKFWFGLIRYSVEIIFIKDPCKECIVRACCSEPCELKRYIIKYFSDIDSKDLKFRKFNAIMILLGHALLIYTIFKSVGIYIV